MEHPLPPVRTEPIAWTNAEHRGHALRYVLGFSVPLATAISLASEGWASWIAVIYGFGMVPLLEIVFSPARKNVPLPSQDRVRNASIFRIFLWLMVVFQVAMLGWFIFQQLDNQFFTTTWWGHTVSMGLLCAVGGINVAHEMGHRTNTLDKFGANVLLVTALYTHFHVEHNEGHHRNVGIPGDPASARMNEWVWSFLVRAISGGWMGALRIERLRLRRLGLSPWNLRRNRFLKWQVVQWGLLIGVGVSLGWEVALAWGIASAIGSCVLESTNYIEHYGLERARVTEHRYARVRPSDSWNSDHVIGRMMLFELTRHSDHHHRPDKPYQTLEHWPEAPQLPTGYPGMMLLSFFPPLFFAVMNPKIARAR